MKKILLPLFLCCLIYANINAQPAKFTKNLDAYTGTWEYVSDTLTFRIYLKKGKSYYRKGGPLSHELIYGGHYIKRNGVVITNLEEFMKTATDEDSGPTIDASNCKWDEEDVNPNRLGLTFRDDLKDKRGDGQLLLIEGNPMKLHWQIQKMQKKYFMWEVGVDPEPVIQPGWTVPTDIILTKVAGPPPPNIIIPIKDKDGDENLIEMK